MADTNHSPVAVQIAVCEWLALLWFALLLLLFAISGSLFVWFALPQTPTFSLGNIADFQPGDPQLVNLRTDVAVYVVRWQTESTTEPRSSLTANLARIKRSRRSERAFGTDKR
jgi:hypothetical protein